MFRYLVLFSFLSAVLLLPRPAVVAASPQPRNPLAAQAGSLKLRIEQPGLYRVSAQSLAAAGWTSALQSPGQIMLQHQGQELPLEIRDGGDGRLDPQAGDELRFSAVPAPTRFDAASYFWLALQPGTRLRGNASLPAAPVLGWHENTIYDSRFAASDGDRWYGADLNPQEGPINLSLQLPTSVANPSLRLFLQGYTQSQHRVEVLVNNTLVDELVWGTGGTATAPFSTTLSLDGPLSAGTLQIQLRMPDSVELDGVYLDRLELPGVSAVLDPAVRELFPQADLPASLQSGGADYLMIGPGELLAQAAPLADYYRGKGLLVELLDVQQIYDAFSFGQLSPEAIRDFVRYSAASWNPQPRALLLIGDASIDPRNYLGYGSFAQLPSYLAEVDPWLGETACDSCYARLDADDVHDDQLPDLYVGRIPARTPAQVAAVVQKTLNYLLQTASGGWNSRALFVADNYYQPDGSIDSAGDFVAFSEELIAITRPDLDVQRFYYDPYRPATPPAHYPYAFPPPDFHYANVEHLRADLLQSWDAGAALVVYSGHASVERWAYTAPNAAVPYLFYLYDSLRNNANRLPVLLSLTCLTGAFQVADIGGAAGANLPALDEFLLLHDAGGTVASLSPTGLGVSRGHDRLSQAVLQALLRPDPADRSLGAALAAGQAALAQGDCCYDLLYTYHLLGDPLLEPQIEPLKRLLVPRVAR